MSIHNIHGFCSGRKTPPCTFPPHLLFPHTFNKYSLNWHGYYGMHSKMISNMTPNSPSEQKINVFFLLGTFSTFLYQCQRFQLALTSTMSVILSRPVVITLYVRMLPKPCSYQLMFSHRTFTANQRGSHYLVANFSPITSE